MLSMPFPGNATPDTDSTRLPKIRVSPRATLVTFSVTVYPTKGIILRVCREYSAISSDTTDKICSRNGPCPSKANSGLPSCHIRAPPPPRTAANVSLSVARNTLLRASSSPPLHAPARSHSRAWLVGVILNRSRASDSPPPPGT